ncbi:hypothetical protein ATO8_18210 [Roseivivax marinus]|uniref:Uncharacterized protein n=1 Tax=Roseivivax marinus TaxID=1379903 RepID=W4HEX8_9RHOB|nr:hypothetical protein [Roseivivax marinus]ETW11264.1 hypothetical protein ATO8_18210 [Roseivivax marinus]
MVTIILSIRSYAILRGELRNVGVEEPGNTALGMLSLRDPDLDWCALPRGMGVEAGHAATAEAFDTLVAHAMSRPGPFLIEADIADA